MTGALVFLEELADLVADRVVVRLTAGQPGWVDQHGSPLGPKRHRAAVRRRVGQGQCAASIVRRRFPPSPEALADELGKASRHANPDKPTRAEGTVAAELASELRLVHGPRKTGTAE